MSDANSRKDSSVTNPRVMFFQAPGTKTGSDGKPDPSSSEPFALEAHYFTESRLLQRDVEIVLESVNNKNLVMLHERNLRVSEVSGLPIKRSRLAPSCIPTATLPKNF